MRIGERRLWVKFDVQNKPYLPNQQCFQQKKINNHHPHFQLTQIINNQLAKINKEKNRLGVIKYQTTATATRHRVSCDGDEGERQR